MLRRRSRADTTGTPPIDLAALDDRWRRSIEDIEASRARLKGLITDCRPGPVQDRLRTIAERVDQTAVAAAQLAFRAQRAASAVRGLGLEDVRAELKRVRRQVADSPDGSPGHDAAAAELRALEDKHAALNQLANTADDAAEHLRLLDLRVGAAVARAAQIALLPDADVAMAQIERDVTAVVDELAALQAGLDAVATPPGST
ncbi:MAG TPA: hypothetical protein VF230_02115 [Acidimicrobiales bacterium]